MGRKLKIGDIVIGRKPRIMNHTNDITTTVGKKYSIIDIKNNEFVILDDNDQEHYFHFKSKWFYTSIIKMRKDKLKKLNEINLHK